jgi:hypothetical protein
MAVTHSTAARDAATDAVVDLVDGGVGAGKLVFRISPSSVGSPGTAAATLTMSDPAFGASSSGTATASAITSDTNAAGNGSAVAYATLQTSADTIVIHCQVAASASDINMSGGLTIGAGDTVSCSSLTYTALSA